MGTPRNDSTNHLGQPIGFPVPGWTRLAVPSGQALEGRWCRLERLDAKTHAADLHAANATDRDGRMWTYLPYGPFESYDRYRDWLDDMARKSDPIFYAIVNRDGGKPVGVASYLRIDPQNGAIEVGHLAYSPLLQRRPAATEAMFLMMQQVFELGYRRYEWKCNALNAPSQRAAERLGFTFEGVFRQAMVVKGANRDTAWFSITDGEWPALREAYLRWLDPGNFNAAGKQRRRLGDLTRGALEKREDPGV